MRVLWYTALIWTLTDLLGPYFVLKSPFEALWVGSYLWTRPNNSVSEYYLQATASAAGLSSPRCLEDKMLKRFADATAALERRDSNFACLYA